MKLTKNGVYRIIGKEFELLANVEGTAPLLIITGALLMNDLVRKGKFTVLDDKSMEVIEVLTHPENFIFFEYEYSDEICLPSYRSNGKGEKLPPVTDEEYQQFKNRYILDVTSGRGIGSTKLWIIDRKDWSVSQAHIMCMKIAKELKKEGVL